MTLPDLIAACEAGFMSVTADPKHVGMEITSGGPDLPGNQGSEPSALYATEALALSSWLDTFNKAVWLDGEPKQSQALIWVEKPYIETYRMTLGDKYNSYRIVRDRYVVRGTVATETYVPEEKEIPIPDEVLTKPKRRPKAA